MFGIGFTELLLILIIALVFIGPEKFPELVKTVAKFAGELKKGSDELKRTINSASSLDDKSAEDGTDFSSKGPSWKVGRHDDSESGGKS